MICDNCGKKFNACEGVENPFHNFCAKKCEDEFMKRKGDIRRQAARVVFNPELTPMIDKDVEDALQKIFGTKIPAYAHDQVKHPSRYNQGGIEFWDVEKAFFGLDSHVDHLVQSALEYGVRFRRKNGAQDLRKGANLLNVAADLLDGKTAKDEPVEKPHPLQNMNTQNINDVCYAIETFEIEHDGKRPTVVLVNGKLYNALMAEIIMNSAQFKPAEKPNDNTTYIMGVRVVVTESTKNHLDMEVL